MGDGSYSQRSLRRHHPTHAHTRTHDTRLTQIDDIPDLDEEGREDLTRIVAQAPRVPHARVQPISELQRDQAWVPAGAGGGGGGGSTDTDLSLLTACLCPSEQVQDEVDEVWEPDQLLAALKYELMMGLTGDDALLAGGWY